MDHRREPPPTAADPAIAAANPAGYSIPPGTYARIGPTAVVPSGLLGRESFTWRFWRTPSWLFTTVVCALIGAGMVAGVVMNIEADGVSWWMLLVGGIGLLLCTTALNALVGRTRADADGLAVRTLFTRRRLPWREVPGALGTRAWVGARGTTGACVTVRAPGGRRQVDVPGTTRVGFSNRALERAEADRDGILAWALGQGYVTHADLRL